MIMRLHDKAWKVRTFEAPKYLDGIGGFLGFITRYIFQSHYNGAKAFGGYVYQTASPFFSSALAVLLFAYRVIQRPPSMDMALRTKVICYQWLYGKESLTRF
jgi:hypothetical protein